VGHGVAQAGRSLESYAVILPNRTNHRSALMQATQSAVEIPEAPFGAVVARQLSVWPFAARTLRLFVLVDPSLSDPSLRRGLVRAMQQGYFRSDGCSQTRAVREAALAAHYVLRHHNRDALPNDQVSAATAVAAVRGDIAFVALAGDAAAFAWRDGMLTGQRGILRVARPLGMEPDPRITLWSTPLATGDRLVLVCGATWSAESPRTIEEILGDGSGSADIAEERLAQALGGQRPAGVMIVDSSGEPRPERQLTLVSAREPGRAVRPPAAARATPSTSRGSWGRRSLSWLSPIFAVALLGVAAVVALNPGMARPPLSMAQLVPALDELNTYAVNPAMAVRLGPSGGNVVDLAVGDDAVYTLDVVEGSVRAFALDGRDQQPTQETLLVRTGTPLGVGGRRLSVPVAIHYVPGATPELGSLAIVDQARAVVQVGPGRTIALRQVPSSASWLELGALSGDSDGHLLVLDSGARRLLEYPSLNQRVVDPPRMILEATSAQGLSFEHAAEIVAQQNQVFLRLDDGTLRRFDLQGNESPIVVQPADGRLPLVRGIAPDRQAGLFLADPLSARVLHTTADGAILGQFRDPALAGLRQIQSSLDGNRLYGLVAAGVLVFDLPETVN
jgi:hypothetical protein